MTTPTPRGWEQAFRQKWEGANAGVKYTAISSIAMDEIIKDVQQQIEEAYKKGYKKGSSDAFLEAAAALRTL